MNVAEQNLETLTHEISMLSNAIKCFTIGSPDYVFLRKELRSREKERDKWVTWLAFRNQSD